MTETISSHTGTFSSKNKLSQTRRNSVKLTKFYKHEYSLTKEIKRCFLSTISSKARASRGSLFFLCPDFYELWQNGKSTCLLTEVKQQWAMLVLGWVTASVHYSCL